ncbi:hypothetical protein [Corynebacterium halotolerans]|uniref:hypothetical protein n=1 Tax=Corynebacterium halotolerans TaxID=225326 RepID=UPI003CFAED4A
MKKRGLILGSLAATATVFLAGCSSGNVAEPGPEMGNAVALPSPAAPDPAGRVIELPAERSQITDMERAGDTIALRSESALTVGTLDQIESGDAEVLDVAAACGDLTATGDTFVLPCDTTVYLIDAAAPSLAESVTTEEPATAAALTSTGELIVGSDTAENISVYRGNEDPANFDVEGATTQMVSVPVTDQPDAVVRIWNPETIIQDVDWTNDRQGATLRVGIGVGQMAPGPDGLVLVSDTAGSQLAVYTADDVIRLHQTYPVDQSPWAVAWDNANELAWTASTAENTLTGYDISQGEPVEQAKLDSVADAKNILVLDDGTLLAASESGDGLQVIDEPLA